MVTWTSFTAEASEHWSGGEPKAALPTSNSAIATSWRIATLYSVIPFFDRVRCDGRTKFVRVQ
jgi:hypothetical protein